MIATVRLEEGPMMMVMSKEKGTTTIVEDVVAAKIINEVVTIANPKITTTKKINNIEIKNIVIVAVIDKNSRMVMKIKIEKNESTNQRSPMMEVEIINNSKRETSMTKKKHRNRLQQMKAGKVATNRETEVVRNTHQRTTSKNKHSFRTQVIRGTNRKWKMQQRNSR